MNKKRINLLLFFVLVLLFPSKADAITNVSFFVQPDLGSNQYDKHASYFDILAKPNSKQTLTMNVSNYSSKKNKLVIIATDSTTDADGSIDTTPRGGKPDSKYLFTKMVDKKKKVITLSPNKDGKVSFTVTMPKDEFNGQVMGGFYVYSLTQEKAAKKKQLQSKKTGVSIRNKISYSYSVVLRNNTNPVKPDVSLEPAQVVSKGGTTMLESGVKNKSQALFTKGQISYKLYKMNDGGSKLYVESTRRHQAISPKTTMPLLINWPKEKLTAGNYILTVDAYSMGNTWNMYRRFTVTLDQANKLNGKQHLKKNNYDRLIKIVIIVLILLFVAVCFWIYFYSKKRITNKIEKK